MLWYTLQNNPTDAWDNGTHDPAEAVKMLYENDNYNLIAVIDEESHCCIDEIYKR